MANKLINELTTITGNELSTTDLIPIQTTTGTNSIMTSSLLQSTVVSDASLKNMCIMLLNRLNTLEDKTPTDVIINQYYGGGSAISDGSCSHAFVELYNPTSATIDLVGKSLHYFVGTTVSKLDLIGSIPSKCSFLIRCKLTNNGTVGVPPTLPALDLTSVTPDMEWDTFISNKLIAFALMGDTNTIAAGTNPTTLPNFIDGIGSSDDKGSAIPWSVGLPVYDQSKQKSVRRILFSKSGNNRTDCEVVDYRLKENLTKAPKTVASGTWTWY